MHKNKPEAGMKMANPMPEAMCVGPFLWPVLFFFGNPLIIGKIMG